MNKIYIKQHDSAIKLFRIDIGDYCTFEVALKQDEALFFDNGTYVAPKSGVYFVVVQKEDLNITLVMEK